MSASNPSTRSAVWAESGQTTAPSQGEQQSGFVAGKPSRRKTNWLLNWIDNAVQWYLTRGLPTYASDAIYNTGARVLDSSGYSWQCLVNGTTNVTPVEGANWTKWGHTDGQVDDLIDAKLGTLSGQAAGGTITITAVDTNVTYGYAWLCRFPGSTVKQLFIRLTITAADHMGGTLTLSGATAFATGADNVIAMLASGFTTGTEQAYAQVTNNQEITFGIRDAGAHTYTVELMVQGH